MPELIRSQFDPVTLTQLTPRDVVAKMNTYSGIILFRLAYNFMVVLICFFFKRHKKSLMISKIVLYILYISVYVKFGFWLAYNIMVVLEYICLRTHKVIDSNMIFEKIVPNRNYKLIYTIKAPFCYRL